MLFRSAPGLGGYTSVYGVGGAMGFLIARQLEAHLSHFGSLLVLLPVLAIGLLFLFDASLLRMLGWMGRGGAASVRAAATTASRLRERRRAAAVEPAAAVDAEPTAERTQEEAGQEDAESAWEHPDQELKIVRTGFEAKAADEPEDEEEEDVEEEPAEESDELVEESEEDEEEPAEEEYEEEEEEEWEAPAFEIGRAHV